MVPRARIDGITSQVIKRRLKSYAITRIDGVASQVIKRRGGGVGGLIRRPLYEVEGRGY